MLAFFAWSSSLEARYCGRSFDVGIARTRWANALQGGPSSENAAQICRDYGTRFYEAVEARQAVSECKAGIERHKDIEILDAEIEAFNNLIATYCGT
jgi:hypothetical protein